MFWNESLWLPDIYFTMFAFCLHLYPFTLAQISMITWIVDLISSLWSNGLCDHHRIKLSLKLQCSKAASIKHGRRKKERWGENDGERSNRLSEVVEVSVCVRVYWISTESWWSEQEWEGGMDAFIGWAALSLSQPRASHTYSFHFHVLCNSNFVFSLAASAECVRPFI